MLTELKIDNILLMENLQIEFCDGFTAITGQTGAGKSVLLDSIGIILGKRAETSILRNPEKHGIIVATFKNSNKDLNTLLYENGFLEKETDDTIIVKKIITKNGSKIFINDIQTTVQFVNSIAEKLLEIYSQFEQTDLFNIKKHLLILDNFGNLKEEHQQIKQLYSKMREAENRYQIAQQEIEKQKENLEYLENFIHDVEALRLDNGEYENLQAEKKQMVDSEKIATYIQTAYSVFNNAKIGTVVNKTQDNLQRAEGVLGDNDDFKGKFFAINEALESVYNSSQLAEELLADFASKHNFNEERLDEIEDRVSAINEIARKYQTTPYELVNQYEMAKNKVSRLSISEEILQKLLKDVDTSKQEFFNFADNLSLKRKEIAKKLEQLVIEKLANLKMEKVKFFANFEEIEPSEYGIDRVVFFASMNAGLTPAPIHKIASGGELSRFMLAFKSALCETKNTATVIFDEIDTGVSGNVAFAIGKEMQNLAKHTQVICITHNSQTAACAQEHLFVKKEQNLDVAKTFIKKLSYDERIKAIAEMISGDEITNEAITNAKMLLELANKSR